MSDCVGAPRMPVCRENYPFVCSTIKSADNVPIEFAIENGAPVRIVFLNYQSQKHKHQRSRSRQHVFTALLDNGSVHRATANRLNIESRATRGSVCNALLSSNLVKSPQAGWLKLATVRNLEWRNVIEPASVTKIFDPDTFTSS